MFEKFTKKAVDVIQAAQNYALQYHHNKVLSCHILMGLVAQTKGVQAKIMNFDKINFAKLSQYTKESLPQDCASDNKINIIFSLEARNILKRAVDLTNELNSKFTSAHHIALAIFENKDYGAYKILKKFNIEEEKIISNLRRMLDKSSDIKLLHPEVEPENITLNNINDFFREKTISEILSNAQSKLTTSGYEIVGTEQIMQSVLENKDYKITEVLENFSIDSEIFAQKVKEIPSRSAEFENSEKQIIFTPNAFSSLMLAVDYAKESGCVEIRPEHVVLGVLKSKRGIAYKILSSLLPKGANFEEIVMKKLNDKIPETLAILRLAKEITISLGSSTTGSEMILLGILSYGTGIAADTLRRLGITFRDAKNEVEKLIKPQNNPQQPLTYSPRAKKLLEVAYETAQEHKKTKIKSENLLYGITKMPNCLAMKVLTNLGTDILEIQQGIKQELLGGMDL